MNFSIINFVNSYIATAVWSTIEDPKECTDLTPEARETAYNDCFIFISECIKEFGYDKANELLSIEYQDGSLLAPHDFWLNRNRHGSGFWDKPEYYGEYTNKLSEIAKKQNTRDLIHVRSKRSKLIFY